MNFCSKKAKKKILRESKTTLIEDKTILFFIWNKLRPT